MGSSGIFYFYCNHKLNHIAVCFLCLLISTSTQLRCIAEGRPINIPTDHFQEEKAMLRAQIGSRPPKCEMRCRSCGHCEAIQVPTNPQTKFGGKNSSLPISTVHYARGDDDSSNYKPMSWKCKCGDSIFNP